MSETLDGEEKAAWHPGEEGRLTKDEAHDEANMMRVKLGVFPRNSRIATDGNFASLYEGERPSSEEYESAFKIIEQLKQAAKDEPTYQKVAAQIMRIAARPVQELLHRMDFVDSENSVKNVEKWHEERLKTFEDAEKRLKDLQKSGKLFGELESDWHHKVPDVE
jgi:hypothetical protein